MFRNRFKLLARITAFIVCITASKGYSICPADTPLDINLTRIISQDRGEGTNVQKLENQCLSLLNDYSSPEDKGKIYAKIAFMYSCHGYSSPNDIRVEKTTKYCKKALEYPLDLLTTCEVYSGLSGSEVVPYMDGSEIEFIKARKEAAVICLKGLKLVLDNNAPKELKAQVHPMQIIYNYDGEPNDPMHEEIKKKNEEQFAASMAARKKEEFEQKLYFLRRGFIDNCVSLYSYRPPYDTNELETFVKDALKGHDDAIDEIMTKVRERISRQVNQ